MEAVASVHSTMPPPDEASIKSMGVDRLVATLAEFGTEDERLARACFTSLLCRVMDKVARQGEAYAELPFVCAVTGAMLAHKATPEFLQTGGMLLAPVLTGLAPSREALSMGAEALVAMMLPMLPLSGSAALSQIAPNVLLLLALVARNSDVLLDAGAVGLFEAVQRSRHVPEDLKVKCGVAVEIVRDGDITLTPEPSFEEWQANEARKASVLAAKARGTAAFRRGEWELAAREYGAALEVYAGAGAGTPPPPRARRTAPVYSGPALTSEEREEQRAEQVVLHSNRAEAFLRLDEYQAARECATAALELDPAHGKSLHRRARALRQLGPWIGGDAALVGAEADLLELTRLGGGAAAAKLLAEVREVQARMRAARGEAHHSHVSQFLEREREARLAGPTPYQGLQRSGMEGGHQGGRERLG